MLKHIKTFYVELLPHLVILELQDFKGKPRFLYGDSMGAAMRTIVVWFPSGDPYSQVTTQKNIVFLYFF